MYFNSHSWFSLRYGTITTRELVETAAALGIKTLALTDINNSTDALVFVIECRKSGITPITGIEFRAADDRLLYIGLAVNAQGFLNLNRFLTQHNLSETPLPEQHPELDDVIWLYIAGKCTLPETLKTNEYIGIPPAKINRLPASNLLKNYAHKLVFCQSITHQNAANYQLHRHLRAVKFNTLLSKLQPGQCGSPTDTWLSLEQEAKLKMAWPDIAKQTEALAQVFSFDFDFSSPKNKKTFSGDADTDRQILKSAAEEGFIYRYGKQNTEARERLEKELQVIDKLGFNSYFLITYDMVRFSMHKGFYHVGRGSGANSIVAYCLKITDVDPIELDLYFERFLNPKRSSPPDFDIDYSWDERDTVIEYLFNKWSKEHTALLGTVSTFSSKSITREFGKVYGLSPAEIDRLESTPSHYLNNPEIKEKITQLMYLLEGRAENGAPRKLQNFPNLRSIHAGGILISDMPICQFCALDLPPKGFPTIQFDMYTAETLHLDKLDVLSQRGIGHIKMSVEIIKENRGLQVDIHRVQDFLRDGKIKQQLKSADTIGCFYIESPAMRQLLTKLRCSDYLTLVAASSIIRPGVSQSGMMKQYIERFHKPNGFKYLHPVMEQQLNETYGVMVYQEDVIKICHHFAGMDLGDADILRRAMSGKYRSKEAFLQIERAYFQGCQALGRPYETAVEVWRQVSSFGGYSFSKAHSASYAVESYQSLFLKTYFPLEFYVAVINNFGGFYATWLYVHAARMAGAQVKLPCVNNSMRLTSIKGVHLWLGFIHINGLEQKFQHLIPEERLTRGPYVSTEDFVRRTGINHEQLVILIKTGALRFTGKTKQDLLMEAVIITKSVKTREPAGLFPDYRRQLQLKPARKQPYERKILEDAYHELNYLGFTVSVSEFSMLQTEVRSGLCHARMLTLNLGKYVTMVGKLVTYKLISTRTGKPMIFGTFIDEEGYFFDTTHFPQMVDKFKFKGQGIYKVSGKVIEEFGVHTIEIDFMEKLPIKPLHDF